MYRQERNNNPVNSAVAGGIPEPRLIETAMETESANCRVRGRRKGWRHSENKASTGTCLASEAPHRGTRENLVAAIQKRSEDNPILKTSSPKRFYPHHGSDSLEPVECRMMRVVGITVSRGISRPVSNNMRFSEITAASLSECWLTLERERSSAISVSPKPMTESCAGISMRLAMQ